MKNMLIRDPGASCQIMNNDTDLYDVTDHNKLVQRSLGNMSAMKMGKLCMKVLEVDGSKKLHIYDP